MVFSGRSEWQEKRPRREGQVAPGSWEAVARSVEAWVAEGRLTPTFRRPSLSRGLELTTA